MMCYRDKTFCTAEECQSFTKCSRALTEDVQRKAEAAGLLIARFADPKELDCYNPKSESLNQNHEDTIPEAERVS
jgi:hypothetical protein